MRPAILVLPLLGLVGCAGACPEPASGVAFSVAMPDEHGDNHVLACDCSSATEADCVVSRESSPCSETDVVLALEGDGPIAVDASPEVVGEISSDDATTLREACASGG